MSIATIDTAGWLDNAIWANTFRELRIQGQGASTHPRITWSFRSQESLINGEGGIEGLKAFQFLDVSRFQLKDQLDLMNLATMQDQGPNSAHSISVEGLLGLHGARTSLQDLYAFKSGDLAVCPIYNTYILVPHDATRFHIFRYIIYRHISSYVYARHCQTTIYQHHQDTVAAEQHESDPLVHLGLWFLRKRIPNQSPVAPGQCSCASTKTST